MHNLLQACYPQKYGTSGAKAITNLIHAGKRKAENQYGMTLASSVAVIVIFMFLLGHEFDNDPFHGWASVEKIDRYINNTLYDENNNENEISRVKKVDKSRENMASGRY